MHISSIIQICINYTYTSVCTVKSLYMYCCTRRGNEKKMCLCLQLEARNPPTQRIHRGKMQPKSLTAFQRERNAGKGRERVQKRNRNHLSRYTSAEVRCQAGGERCTPGYASGNPPAPGEAPLPDPRPASSCRIPPSLSPTSCRCPRWPGPPRPPPPPSPAAGRNRRSALSPCASRCRPRSGAPRPRRCW